MILKRLCPVAVLASAVVLIPGCGSSSQTQAPIPAASGNDHDHDHDGEGHEHHHAETLPEAITELTELRNTIRDAFAKNDTETAHDPLHEVGHVLELIPELAEKQGISGDALSTIKTSVNTLFDAFGNVDKTLHGQEGSTYSEESAAIDEALKAITDAASGTAPAGTAPAEAAPSPAESTPAPATETPKGAPEPVN